MSRKLLNFGTDQILHDPLGRFGSGKTIADFLKKDIMLTVPSGSAHPNFLVHPDANVIDPLVDTSTITGAGRTSFPNLIGSATKPVGVATTQSDTWVNDTAYTPGVATVAAITGGYDHIVNQIAGTICGGGHNFMPSSTNGHGFIGGGSLNFNAGGYAVITGGTENTIALNSLKSTISGGADNDISANQSTVGGGVGNDCQAQDSVITGGVNNTIQSAASKASINGGENNTITGGISSTINGGNSNGASANYASVTGGFQVVANGAYSIAGGDDVQTSEVYEMAFGSEVRAGVRGALTHTARKIDVIGDCQNIQFAQGGKTTDASLVSLSNNGSSNFPVIPSDSSWTGIVYVQGVDVATGNTAAWSIPFAAKNVAGTGTRQKGAAADGTELHDDIGIVTNPAVNIHSTGLFRVQVTGIAATTIKWTARVELTEVKW